MFAVYPKSEHFSGRAPLGRGVADPCTSENLTRKQTARIISHLPAGTLAGAHTVGGRSYGSSGLSPRA